MCCLTVVRDVSVLACLFVSVRNSTNTFNMTTVFGDDEKPDTFSHGVVFDLCLRRGMGTASLKQLLVFGVDIAAGCLLAKTTLRAWETRTATALPVLSDAVEFSRDCELLFIKAPDWGAGDAQWATHFGSLRFDNTNTTRKTSSHQNIEICCTYLFANRGANGSTEYDVDHLTLWPESVVVDGKDNVGIWRRMTRQLAQIECKCLIDVHKDATMFLLHHRRRRSQSS